MSEETEGTDPEHERGSEDEGSEEDAPEKGASSDSATDEATKDDDKGEGDKAEDAEAEEGGPLFARTYPKTPEVEALVAAFERGNYARVREEAPALAARTTDPQVKRAAEDLFRRIQPDGVAVTLLAVAALLLAFFVYWYLGHPHEVPK